jgi:hypothetical protein
LPSIMEKLFHRKGKIFSTLHFDFVIDVMSGNNIYLYLLGIFSRVLSGNMAQKLLILILNYHSFIQIKGGDGKVN